MPARTHPHGGSAALQQEALDEALAPARAVPPGVIALRVRVQQQLHVVLWRTPPGRRGRRGRQQLRTTTAG